jgi:anti-anti-sigma factor
MSDVRPFSVRCEITDGVLRLIVVGELDMATETDLVDAVRAAVSATDASRVVLDVRGVSFVDSSGLRALLLSRDSATALDLPITMAVAEGPVTRLFEVAGVASWFAYE